MLLPWHPHVHRSVAEVAGVARGADRPWQSTRYCWSTGIVPRQSGFDTRGYCYCCYCCYCCYSCYRRLARTLIGSKNSKGSRRCRDGKRVRAPSGNERQPVTSIERRRPLEGGFRPAHLDWRRRARDAASHMDELVRRRLEEREQLSSDVRHGLASGPRAIWDAEVIKNKSRTRRPSRPTVA